METKKISFKEKLGYGVGDLASNFIWAGASTFLAFFYTDVVGLTAAAVGTLLLIARVLDAFVDIGVGVLIEKTRSRYGKARPWLLWMAFPFGLAGFLLFFNPGWGPTGSLIYAYSTYLLVNIVYSGINVPYGVLNSRITQDPYERSVLNIFRMFFAVVATILVNMLTLPLVKMFGGGNSGWATTYGIFSGIAVIMFLVSFFSTKERVQATVVRKEVDIKRGFKALFRNKYWKQIVLVMVIFYISGGVSGGASIYYAQYVLNDVNLVGTLGLAGMVPVLIGFFLIAPFIKRFGKRNVSIAGLVISLIGSSIIIINPASLAIVITSTVIKSVGFVPLSATLFAMLADTVDYGEWKTGIRNEGLIYSGGSFGLKAGSGIGAGLVGWILAAGGYVGSQAQQTTSAITSIQFMFIYLPIIICICLIGLLMFYKLDKEFPRVLADLEEIKNMKA
ncbi:MFS transporter [Bacillus sp. FJAT-26390]|uniref:MFS transporter n=1 Tax=Bacillus sp. FJAT-26390 TaxID=1743142 RepID=UPI000807B67E|nr:MFS transporter [Bacillus sp. FJAT-26390]OBZ15762.1 sodium:melibiose symporter [Bacillus sp. FJAT-26390]